MEGKLALRHKAPYFFFPAEMDPLPSPSLNRTQLKTIFYQAARNLTIGLCQGTCWAALTLTRLKLLLPRNMPSCTTVSQVAQENGPGDTELLQSQGEEGPPSLWSHTSQPLVLPCTKLRVPLSTLWPPLWTFLQGLVLPKGKRIYSCVFHGPDKGQGE